MIRILFVCTGNICRSPMAEFVMKDLVEKEGLADLFEIASAAISDEEHGNPIYPPALRKLREHGIHPTGKHARQICRADYAKYDMLIGMEHFHLIGMQRIMGEDTEGKMSLLMDFTDRPGGVSDPWYTRDFDSTWVDVCEGCRGILQYLKKNHYCSR